MADQNHYIIFFTISKIFILLLFNISVNAQSLTFQKIEEIPEFNIDFMALSSNGEYFTAGMYKNVLYSSVDGQNWIEENIPGQKYGAEFTFLDDGTPVICWTFQDNPCLIRRDGTWYELNPSPTNPTFIALSTYAVKDTLFALEQNAIYYSLDKGITFDLLLNPTNSFLAEYVDLVRYEDYTLLSYSVFATDYTTVFRGTTKIKETEESRVYKFLHSGNNFAFIGEPEDNYYIYDFDTESEHKGEMTSLIPNYIPGGDFTVANSYFYYLSPDNNVYRTQNPLHTWELYKSINASQTFEKILVDYDHNINLYNKCDYEYFNIPQNTSSLTAYEIGLNSPNILDFIESTSGMMIAQTIHHIYRKTINSKWQRDPLIDFTSVPFYISKIEFSPAGALYVSIEDAILFSPDGYPNYQEIEVPDQHVFENYQLYVVDNDILLLDSDNSNQNYYSVNNGIDWINSDFPFNSTHNKVKYVDNEILIADNFQKISLTRINTMTNETITSEVSDFFESGNSKPAILNDGTMLFINRELNSSNNGLYSFTESNGVELIENLSDNFYIDGSLVAVESSCYIISIDSAFIFSNEEFSTLLINGLEDRVPSQTKLTKSGYIGSNDYSNIYKSVEKLVFPNTIDGKLRIDINENCESDTGEQELNGWNIKVEGENVLKIVSTTNNGSFNVSVPNGNYNLSVIPENENWEVCQTGIPVTIDNINNQVTQDLFAQIETQCSDLSIDLSTPFLRRCFDNYYAVRIRNNGTTEINGAVLFLELDPFFDILDFSIPYNVIDDHLISLELEDLKIGEHQQFRIDFNLSCKAEFSAIHCIKAYIEDLPNVCDTNQISYQECRENIGSFDPNDKRCFNENGDETNQVNLDEYFNYHIRFQNTGTDTAFNIKVVDSLSSKFDLTTFEMLSSSHSNRYVITDGPKLEVYFDNILLPDSTTNLLGSNGYFKFKIKPRSEYDLGEIITNQASIYFDFNEPIITNETSTQIAMSTNVKDVSKVDEIELFPNPTSDKLFVKNLNNKFSDLIILNIFGERISCQVDLDTKVPWVDIGELPSGIYLIICISDKTEVVKKFLVN